MPKVGTPGDDDWLARWHESVDAAQARRVLDIGCGPGHDTMRLQGRGRQVVSLDFSREALRRVQSSAEATILVQSDLADGLPFQAHAFGLITASFVRHYFNQQTTQIILTQLRDCLISGGRILMRLNGRGDDTCRGCAR